MAQHESEKAELKERAQRRGKVTPSPSKQLEVSEPELKVTGDSPSVESPSVFRDTRFSHPANIGQKIQVASQLQRSHGNAYVQRLLDPRAVQAKLVVNPPDDQYEREADRVADAVVRSTDSRIQRQADVDEEAEEVLQGKPATASSQFALQRQPEEEEEEEELIQGKSDGTQAPPVSEALEERITAARDGGQPLDDSVRAFAEPHFGVDIGDVRVHTDAEADNLSKGLNAKAFTAGKDVFFRHGDYQPGSPEGMRLLAHELTHVAQQKGAHSKYTGKKTQHDIPPHVLPASKPSGIQRQGAAHEEEEEPWWLKKGVTAKRGAGIDKEAAAEKLGNVDTRARGNAISFSDEVGKACDHFETYAKPKISALKGELTAGELVSSLIGAALGPLREVFTERFASVLGEKLTAAVTGKFDTAVTDTAKKVVSTESDVASLEDAVVKACAGAKDAATRLKDAVGEHLTPAIDAAQRRLYGGLPLTKSQEEMVGMFYEAPVQNVDDYLERFYGVPSKAKARTVQIQVYYHLVRRFEEKLLEAEMPMDFKERMRKRALKGHIASQRALSAAEERKKALEGE